MECSPRTPALGSPGVLINDTDLWACPTPDESAPLDVSLGICIFRRDPPRFRCLSVAFRSSFFFTGHWSVFQNSDSVCLLMKTCFFPLSLGYYTVLLSVAFHSLYRLTFSCLPYPPPSLLTLSYTYAYQTVVIFHTRTHTAAYLYRCVLNAAHTSPFLRVFEKLSFQHQM